MTHVDKSPVTREVRGLSENEFVTKMTQEGLYIREKGRRLWYGPMSWDYIFRRGAELKAMSEAKPRKPRFSRSLLGR